MNATCLAAASVLTKRSISNNVQEPSMLDANASFDRTSIIFRPSMIDEDAAARPG